MGCCKTGRSFSQLPSKFRKYPCRSNTEEGKPCPHKTLESLRALLQANEKDEQEQSKAEDSKVKKKGPCEDVKPPSKKKFLQIGPKQICAMPFSRKWNPELSPESSPEGFPKWFKGGPKMPHKNICPRELDDYEKSLWIPICKTKENVIECKDPIDPAVCVFCLENLYAGGYIHELFEKVPLIKKQSELYGDEIAWRIGIRTRIIVHKKCYDSYIDTFAHKSEAADEVIVELGNDEIEESEDLNCGEAEEEEKEEQELEYEEEGEEEEEVLGEDTGLITDSASTEVSKYSRKQNFCLGKYKIPKIDPENIWGQLSCMYEASK